jgi:plasmid replication initiation protein
MNNSNEIKSLQLSKDYYSVVANEIIKGKQRMTLREMQLLQLVISQIVKNDTELVTYTTTATELAHFLGIHQRSLYRDLDQITDKLLSRIIKINVDGVYTKFQWLSKCSYDTHTKKITLKLHEDLRPYLTELERFYSQIKIETLLSFTSYYTVRLYQLLVCNWGEREQEEYYFSCDDCRDFFQVEDNKYKQNADLIKKTIKFAVDELNASDYCIISDYEEVRAATRGTPIQGVKFTAVMCSDAEDKNRKLLSDEKLKLYKAQAGDSE